MNEATTGDLLSAASVLAALLTFLYGVAYASITAAIDIERGERKAPDLRPEQRQVAGALFPAIGVCLAALALAGIFTPKVIDLIRDGDVFGRYDPIVLSLVVVWLTFVLVAIHAARSVWLLLGKRRELTAD